MELTRREALAGGAAVLASTPLQARAAPGAQSLDGLARRSSRRFGSAVAWSSARNRRRKLHQPCLCRDPRARMRAAGAGEPAQVAVGPALSRHVRLSAPSTRSPIMRPAQGFKLRGHTLFWTPTKWYPKWLAETSVQVRRRGRATAGRACAHGLPPLRRRASIRTTWSTKRCSPKPAQIRDTNVTRALGGEAFLDLMFHTARAEAPHAAARLQRLYELGAHGRRRDATSAGVLKLLEGFRKRGTPVDALGVQSHIRLLKTAPVAEIVRESEGPWRRFLDEVVAWATSC